MKTDSVGLRLNHAKKLRLQREAKQNNTTLSKQILRHIDKVSIQLANSGKNYDPQMEKIADMLEASLRLLTKVKKVDLATHGEGSRSTQQTVFDYAEAILQWSELQVEGKPINATLRAIKQAKTNQQIKRIR